jgi:malate dehydrogenase (oxaloacetate-decarboxylating)(NADP+)
MYFSACELPYFSEMVRNWPQPEVDVVVVTDGSRILGLGDLGANGMGIPIGKLALYVVGAGLYPCKTLPVLLDVGTDNAALRNDPLYLGERIPRLRDEAFFEVMEAFVTAVHTRWPEALIQFEDFSNNHAFPLLERYRDRVPCFNDDIQGTGAVTLAGLLSALRVSGEPLGAQRVLFSGAGSAARGIADTIVAAAMAQDGLDLVAARRQIWMMDSQGLVTRARLDRLARHKRDFAHDAPPARDLLDIVRQVKPSVLIGVSKQPGAFTERVIREMHKHVRRPIIFPLSNPTAKAECTAEQAYHWTQGAALFASGSPFAPVTVEGRIFVPGQCNNMYIFPGVGMGAVTFRIRRITDRMFFAAARTLAGQVGEESLAAGRLFPDLGGIRELSAQIAVAVGEVAFAEGLTSIDRPPDLLAYVKRKMFTPCYVPYEAV